MTNFSDVRTYFERIPPPRSPDVYLAQIDHLGYAPHAPSHTHNLIFEVDVDGFGSVLIRCRNIAIRTNEQTEFTFL
jgi:hypothetical protein